MTTFGNNAQSILKAYIERIQKLEAEKADIAAAVADVYSEAKANGFDTKIMKKTVAYAKKTASEIHEELEVLNLYLTSIGVYAPKETDEE